ncbi:MAG: TonB-dependent receptor [Mangrovibacterium sp.]
MKLTFGLILLLAMQSWAVESYSQKTVRNLSMQNADIIKVLEEIENQTDYYFLFNYEQLNKGQKVDVSLSNSSIGETLKTVLAGTGLKYTIADRQIVISRDEDSKASSGAGSQQLSKVTGKVSSAQGDPVPGATVVVKGSNNGTITDFDGKFTIGNVPANGVLVFSFIGMKTAEIPVNGQQSLNVVMEDETVGLEEVVAIGYGTVKKKDLTGAVSSVKTEDIVISPTSNVMEALQGKVAGMDIIKTSGQVGKDVDILLRGNRSIYGSNQPLFIIDGIPGSYSQVNPSDIESVDVLKDASSTAIYGSAGSNGVVIITTKRGKTGKATVNFDAYYGFSGTPEFFHGMVGDEWTKYQREAYNYLNGQYPADMSAILSDADKLAAYNDGKWIDWVDEASGNVATDQKYSLSITSGTEKTKLFSSITYTRQEGLLSNEDLNRYAVRLNIDQEIFSWAKIGLTSNLSYSLQNNGVNNTFTKAISSFPLGDAYDANGNINWEFAQDEYSPLGDFIENQFVNNTRATYINTNAYLDLSLLEGLSLKSVISGTLGNSRLGQYWGAHANANRPTYAGTPHAEILNSYSYGYTWENILNYNATVATDHSITATLVSSWSKNQSETNKAAGSGQNLDSWTFYRLLSATSARVESDFGQTQKMAFAARLNYSYKGKYLFSASNRWDGVSWLSEGKKWDYFPAAAIAWRVSEESFMTNTSHWMNSLKMRVGYGITGNSGGVGAYQTSTTPYAYSSSGVTVNGEIVPFTQYTGTYGNPGLGWEKSYNINVGLDFGFIDNRIALTMDWFSTKTKDILFKRTMPITSGITGWGSPLVSWENIAETSNKGFEISLNTYNVRTKDFEWNTNLTLTYSEEKIESLPSGDLIAENLFVGEPLSAFYDYEYAGIWGSNTSADDLAAYGVKPGWIKIETVADVADDGTNDGGVHKYSIEDKQVLGHENPDFVLGFNNSFRYKDFDLGVFAMARYGQTIESDLIGWYTAKTGGSSNQIAGADYWTEDNQQAFYPVPGSGNEQITMSALRFRDGSFIKVKNITLGYTLPQRLSNLVLMSKCRVYATAYNPFLYVKDEQLKGTDPETNGSDSFPLYKQFVFGVNVTF